MSAQKLLEYQKIDMNIYKIERAYQQSDEMRRLAQCKAEVKNKRDSLNNLVTELDKCYAMLSALEGKLNEIIEEGKTLDTDFSDFAEIKDYDKYEKDLAKHEENVSNINKDIVKTIRRIAEINDANAQTNDLITKLVAKFDVLKQDAERKRQESLKGAIPYAKKLKELEPEIDETLMKRYKEIRQKKMPVLVPYSDESCLGCGINIKLEVENSLINLFDIAECPHCGRMVYKMK